jgi:hypothetical protein
MVDVLSEIQIDDLPNTNITATSTRACRDIRIGYWYNFSCRWLHCTKRDLNHKL